MPINNYLPALEQVYEFLKERPDFISQSKFEKSVEYFKTLHEGDPQEFKFEAPHNLYGKFGPNRTLSLRLAPDFDNKSNFIKWVYSQLNDQV